MERKISKAVLVFLGLLVIVSGSSFARAPLTRGQFPGDTLRNNPQLAPSPSTVDQVTHNMGNIVTTIDNYGYIGGYGYYGLPSGEYPRNSGHNYLAEIRYWMGAVVAGDTLVANSYDDFQAMPSSINGQDDYKIMLSTDTSRYYQYDVADTVGQGKGSAAEGWKVWDGQTDQWEYNQVYDRLAVSLADGGPTSLQDSHYRFTDDALGSSVLGLEVTHTVYQWNYCYNEDFIFVVMDITNTSANDYAEFAVGLYIDIDVGGPDGTGENGRLEDLVAFDSTENLAWIYDNEGYDPGWQSSTGVMGTKFLETPQNIGMTSFRTDDWAFLPDDDPGKFAMIASTQYDASLPPTDQFYIQSTSGINLTAGTTVRVVYALIAGDDEADFLANSQMAQNLYDSYFVGPEPPPTPTLTAKAGDEKIYLTWNDVAENSTDPLSGVNDFAGYKLYRSDNQGKTWGSVDHDNDNTCMDLDYKTMARYTARTPGDPIQHSIIDADLYNGVEYWYCLAAFDTGDTATGVDVLQTGFGIAGEVLNVVAIRPESDPAGFFNTAGDVTHDYSGTGVASDGAVIPQVFNAEGLTNADYEVVFEDTPDVTYWHLINVTSGDTVLANQTNIDLESGIYEVAEGLRVVVNNGDRDALSYVQTTVGGADSTLIVEDWWYGPTMPALTGDPADLFGDAPFRSTYEIRYTGDSTRANWVLDGFYGSDIIYWVPFEVWNISSGERVSVAVYDFPIGYDVDDNPIYDRIWTAYDLVSIVDYPYDSVNSVTTDAFPNHYSWMFGFDDIVYNPSVGDVFTIEGAPLNGPDDVFSFSVNRGVNASQASADMSKIKVWPNPYFAANSSMIETSEGAFTLTFTNLPDECTIRIYTLAGDLLRSINHDGAGDETWNLMSASDQLIASGTYFYHIESPYGEHLGRFAVIK